MATTTTTVRNSSSPDVTSSTGASRPRRVLVSLVALLGLATLLYPTAARWLTDRQHATTLSSYADEVARLPTTAQRQILDRAHEYNDALPSGPLQVGALPGDRTTGDAGPRPARYLEQLTVPGSDVMATVSVPSIGVTVPVRHGVDEHALANGVGHLPGSSLPVGGNGTHSVLTGHSGLVGSTMFDRLDDVKPGDVIEIVVLDTTLRYEVDQLRTVTPDDTSSLRLESDKDLLTLVTCTPIGVNSHRLLVTAHRVAGPLDARDPDPHGEPTQPGFPWWAVALAGGFAVVALAAAPGGQSRPRHGKRPRTRERVVSPRRARTDRRAREGRASPGS
ncbi:class C sortase [Cellulosimicrobium cellulans]|uniref:class C sortase n=1 Tax=Cellulosimicrobium cellulans TaxID=1710 RepID=UPI003649FB5E